MRKLSVVKEEAYARGCQPSASRSDLLLECSYWIGREVEYEPSSEAARYGSAFHLCIAGMIKGTGGKLATGVVAPRLLDRALKEYDVEAARDELRDHLKASGPMLHTWLEGLNEYKLPFETAKAWIETAVSLLPLESARFIPSHDDDHRYHGLAQGELPGTGDLIVPKKRKAPLLVLDHKTGEEDFCRPLDKPQLLTLAAAAMRISKQDECVVGVFHARRRGMPKVYTDRVALKELRGYERRLEVALSKTGDGSMRPGPWCQHCPAQSVCPAQDAQLLSKAGDVLTGLTAAGGALSSQGVTANDVTIVKVPAGTLTRDKQLGVLYSVVRNAEKIAARAREEIKKEVLATPGLIPITPEGECLTIREYEQERLSKSSITNAMGKVQGEREIQRLRDVGAVTRSKVVQLYPEKDRGGRS